jgi:hypothetical protein
MSDAAQPDIDLSTDEGIRRFLVDLKEGAEIGKALANARTSIEVIGRFLASWVDSLEASLGVALATEAQAVAMAGRVWAHAEPDFPVEHQSVDHLAWRGGPDSPAETDLTKWLAEGWPQQLLQPSHQQDRGPVLHIGRRLTEAAADHTRGLAVMLADGRVWRPPLALARVVLDATAHIAYLFDPVIDADERIIRALNEVLARAGEDYNEAARADDSDGMATHEGEIKTIFAAVGSRQPQTWNPKGRQLPYLGEKRVRTAQMARALLEGGTSWYDLSDVVHNKEDAGWRMMLGLDATIDNPHRGSALALHTFAAVIGMIRVVESIEAYTAWDLRAVREQDEDLMRFWADASGMFDEQHRTRIRAERAAAGS